MANKSLAILYRPRVFEDMVEQDNIKLILENQLNTGTIKQSYLFCGGAGTGKTTSARIFANEINRGKGNPIELDAASHNSVEDMRNLIQQASIKSLDSEYKVFIIDEAHSISSAGWQAMLKTLEEPPAKAVFIFCTTDPQKIPKTILSRVQRYDFHRISQKGIVDRLRFVLEEEKKISKTGIIDYSEEALEYLAKIADGGMRDAITLMDKCLAFDTHLTTENISKALGTVNYETMFALNEAIFNKDISNIIHIIEEIHNSGKDLKQFVKSYMLFILDVCKYDCTREFTYLQIPGTYKTNLDKYTDKEFEGCLNLLDCIVKLNSEIKWETSPKVVIESTLILFIT